MRDSKGDLNQSAINHAVLYFAHREYHAGRPKAYLEDGFKDGPEALRNANTQEGREYVYRCCHELYEVEMLLTIDMDVMRSVDGNECVALGPKPAISITERGLRYLDDIYPARAVGKQGN